MKKTRMDKNEVSDILREMAILLELSDANPFKIRAYENAARVIEGLDQDLSAIVQAKKLQEIKGIGETISHVITDLVTTGGSKEHLSLKKKIHPGLLDMISIQGVGPKRAKILFKKLHIKSVAELEKACQKHKIEKLEGFGEKSESNILKGIADLKKHQGIIPYPLALHEAEKMKSHLQKSANIERIEIAGSLRRRKESVKDIDLLVSSSKPEGVMKAFTKYSGVERVLAEGETKSSVVLKAGMNADLRVVSDKEFPYALLYFTGSKEHNTEMRSIAKSKHLKLNEYGLFKGTKLLSCENEAAVFKALGLEFIEPELRENLGEIEAARSKKLPGRLIELGDLRGTFHNHTTESDGVATLEQMVTRAQKMGLEYLGISDHSKSAYYANGLKPDRVKKQFKAIEKLNEKIENFVIFKGSEVDILPDGSLDFEDALLSEFDFVIASVHSKFNMSEKEMTQRIIKALKNKYVTMIGHPTGRLIPSREPYPINLYELVDAAADYGKALELNANPHRFDIDWKICKYAKGKKVPVSINPDAHSAEGLQDLQYGIGIARKGWLTPADVLNTRSATEIVKFLKSYR